MLKNKMIVFASCLLVASGVLLRCSDPLQVPEHADLFAVSMSDFSGVYDPSLDKIDLKWQNKSGRNFSFYRITRFVDTSAGGIPVAPYSYAVPGNFNSHLDAPDLSRGNYWYFIVPALIIGSSDTLYGLSSDTISVMGSRGVSFSVNNNATTTAIRDVSLTINDRNSVVQRVLITSVLKNGLPDFDFEQSADPDNYPNRIVLMGAATTKSLPWKLPIGGGNKRVFAKFEYSGASAGVDTSSAEIAIAPYNYRVQFANKRKVLDALKNSDDSTGYRTGPADATVLYSKIKPDAFLTIEEYIFVAPNINFTLSIGADTTVEKEFEYWIVFARDNNILGVIKGNTDPQQLGVATNPRKGLLTGRTVLDHDEAFEYEYSVDTTTTAGKANLTFLTFSENLSGTVAENFAQLKNLSYDKLVSAGKKEFALVIRLKGKHFGEDRYIVSREDILNLGGSKGGAILQQGRVTRSYFDFYAPFIDFVSPQNKEYLNNGDTVTNVLTVPLPVVDDKGNSRIVDLSLVVMRKPQGFVFDYRSWKSATEVVTLSYEQLLSLTDAYQIFPHELGLAKKSLPQSRWEGIDVKDWPSGEYFIGVYVADEYGNKGFAPVARKIGSFGYYQTNPFLVTVLSGK